MMLLLLFPLLIAEIAAVADVNFDFSPGSLTQRLYKEIDTIPPENNVLGRNPTG